MVAKEAIDYLVSIEDKYVHGGDEYYDEQRKTALSMARDALEKQIPMNVVCDGNDESDWVHCTRCNEILGINESVYDAFCDNNYEPIYCHKCGQSLTWN